MKRFVFAGHVEIRTAETDVVFTAWRLGDLECINEPTLTFAVGLVGIFSNNVDSLGMAGRCSSYTCEKK